jgi:hypothetical protein
MYEDPIMQIAAGEIPNPATLNSAATNPYYGGLDPNYQVWNIDQNAWANGQGLVLSSITGGALTLPNLFNQPLRKLTSSSSSSSGLIVVVLVAAAALLLLKRK